MDVPGIVREHLGDEQRMTSVNVGGDDRVYVTPPRTLVYHASGLFSRESIDEYSHDARRFDVSADRREATFAFEYDGGVEAFSVPRERIETVLPPVLAGVLRAGGLIDDDESVEESYRFGERTLVVTDRRLLTSVGEAVWDHDHESDDYANITGLDFEGDGFTIEVDGRTRRIDLADEGTREAYEMLETALCEYHGVESVEDLATEGTRSATDASTEKTAEDERTNEIADAETDAAPTSPQGSSTPESHSPDPPIPEASDTHRSDSGRSDSGRSDSGWSDSDGADSGFETAGSIAESEPSTGSKTGDTGTNADDSGVDASTDRDTVVNDADAIENADTIGGTDGDGDSDGDTDTDRDGGANDDESIARAEPAIADELDALRESVERQTELMERNQELLERLVERVDEGRVNDDR